MKARRVALAGSGPGDRVENPLGIATERVDIERHHRVDAEVGRSREPPSRDLADLRGYPMTSEFWVRPQGCAMTRPRVAQAPGASVATATELLTIPIWCPSGSWESLKSAALNSSSPVRTRCTPP